ncbi:MAG: membrane protein insertase YidC, partial [Saprospiraceae bacterium]|nr:membrane protein insertase YidC [Saprospiraceae bacterium]
QQRLDNQVEAKEQEVIPLKPAEQVVQDSLQQLQFQGRYGSLAHLVQGSEQETVIENDVIKVTFTNKGGRVKEVLLKEHFKLHLDSTTKIETQMPLYLLKDEKNKFDYLLPIKYAAAPVKSSDLYFTTSQSGNTIKFRAQAAGSPNQFFEQTYTITDGYNIDYDIQFSGLGSLFDSDAKSVKLKWVDYLDKIERNTTYERNYATIYYKEIEEDPDYCSCTGDDEENFEGKTIEWVSHSNQFFQSSLLAKEGNFKGAIMETKVLDISENDLKKLESEIYIPIGDEGKFAMDFFIGPKDFEVLQKYNNEFEYTVPFGTSIFGTINRWVIRPLFNFLSGFIVSKGIVILILTLIIKMTLYPLTYKMVHSQSKMAALKPQLASMKERHKDDPQKAQMETMKVYQEFGVNPLGGCLPVMVQMPIWFALYRFFPGSIEFRQADFLWATDLSSFDVAFWLPFEIPFYGMHVSLFTLLWAGTTVLYTWYNMNQMDMTGGMGGQNAKMMKYMQYGMPVMFLFFFNNFAAGLTCYLFFSNLTNVLQMVITKQYIIDHDKIKAQLEANKKKPKKKGGFQARLQDALKEQQKVQAEREKLKGKKGRKK